MTESKISDFKMFEKAPFEVPPARQLTELIMSGLKEVENTYGPVFARRFIKHALKFIAEKIGEKPPEDIKTLDQLKEYLISKSNVYPTSYSAAAYAQWRTENELQGQTGAGTQIGTIGSARSISDKPGLKKREVQVDQVLSNIRQSLVAIGCCPSELGYKENEDGSVDIIVPKCHFRDGCERAFDEGYLNRLDGRLQCGVATGWCILLKLSTGYEWDYDLLESYKPHCIQRCYMI
nr:hypothetical protein [Candidatus Freyarchaeota archaeon]